MITEDNKKGYKMEILYIQKWNKKTGYHDVGYAISEEGEKNYGDYTGRFISYIDDGRVTSINADCLDKTVVNVEDEIITIRMHSRKCDKSTFMRKVAAVIAEYQEDYLKSDFGLFISRATEANRRKTDKDIREAYEDLRVNTPFKPYKIETIKRTYGKGSYMYRFAWNTIDMSFAVDKMAILDGWNGVFTIQDGSSKRSTREVREDIIGRIFEGTGFDTYWMYSISDDITSFKKAVFEKLKLNAKLIEDTKNKLDYYLKCNEALLKGVESSINNS